MSNHAAPETEHSLTADARLNAAAADILGPHDELGAHLNRLAHTQATIALAEATEKLAEQQRLGNIIAWQPLTGESNRGLIRKGLGL